MRSFFLWAAAAAALSSSACGSTSPSAPSPSTTPAPPSSSSSQLTVSIVGSSGSASFRPNPVTAAVGSMVVWTNNDSTRHHIILDNGTEVGNLSPGQASAAIAVTNSGAVGFHCTIHPSMVGTINGATATSPDPSAGYQVREIN